MLILYKLRWVREGGAPNEMKNGTLKIAQFTYYSTIYNSFCLKRQILYLPTNITANLTLTVMFFLYDISTYYGTFLKKYKNICSCYIRFLIKGKLVTILNGTKKLKQLIFYFNLKTSVNLISL